MSWKLIHLYFFPTGLLSNYFLLAIHYYCLWKWELNKRVNSHEEDKKAPSNKYKFSRKQESSEVSSGKQYSVYFTRTTVFMLRTYHYFVVDLLLETVYRSSLIKVTFYFRTLLIFIFGRYINNKK